MTISTPIIHPSRESRQELARQVTESALADRYPTAAAARKADVETRLAAATALQSQPCYDGAIRRQRIQAYIDLHELWVAWNRIGWRLE